MSRRYDARFLSSVPSCPMAILCALMLAISLLSGERAWAQESTTVLHRFTGYAQARGPRGGLVLAPDGNFYGARMGGGAFNAGLVFRMTPDGVVTTIYDFRGGDQGYAPDSALTVGPDGALVGTMLLPLGESIVPSGVFRLTRDGSSYHILHRFDPQTEGYTSDLNDDPARILLGQDGNFYGVLRFGGTRQSGAVYRMTPTGGVTILHAFAGTATDGGRPMALVQASDGGFFGVTESGGPCSGPPGAYCGLGYGNGTLFSMTPAGEVTILHGFQANATDGFLPRVSSWVRTAAFTGPRFSGLVPHRTRTVLVTDRCSSGRRPADTGS